MVQSKLKKIMDASVAAIVPDGLEDMMEGGGDDLGDVVEEKKEDDKIKDKIKELFVALFVIKNHRVRKMTNAR